MQIIKFLPILCLVLVNCKAKEPVQERQPTVFIPEVRHKIVWRDSCKYVKIYRNPFGDYDYKIIHAANCPAFKHVLKVEIDK